MDSNLEEILGVKGKEIQMALEELKKNEIKNKVIELKAKLPNLGRCTVCTLRVPCKHFSTISEVPRVKEAEISFNSTAQGFDVTKYLPKITPKPYERGFTVRYAGRNSIYNLDFNRRHTSLPNEKRLKQLETIESYREQKLKKEIQKIHAFKEQEAIKKQQLQAAEETRKKYLIKQKEKLEYYKSQLPAKQEVVKELAEIENRKKIKAEEKKRKYMEQQRIKLAEYFEKQNIIKNISKQNVIELQETVLNYKPIKIKRQF
jgi:hypothetical protein